MYKTILDQIEGYITKQKDVMSLDATDESCGYIRACDDIMAKIIELQRVAFISLFSRPDIANRVDAISPDQSTGKGKIG
jgi:hypothetical protein